MCRICALTFGLRRFRQALASFFETLPQPVLAAGLTRALFERQYALRHP
jgi:hypothetical protein